MENKYQYREENTVRKGEIALGCQNVVLCCNSLRSLKVGIVCKRVKYFPDTCFIVFMTLEWGPLRIFWGKEKM